MPKYNRQQRFAVLKNIFDELGELGVMRSAARLQVPAEEARALVTEWKGGKKADLPEGDAAPVTRPPRSTSRQAPEREARPVKAKFTRAPRQVNRPTLEPTRPPRTVIKMGEASLPAEKITGDDYVEGYKGVKLFKGQHVRYSEGDAVGVIVNLGKQQSEVKWFRTGVTQAEVNTHLRKK